MKRRVVVEVQQSRRDYTVANDRDFDALMDKIRRGILSLTQKAHCVGVVIVVHMEGDGCDHE